LLVECAEIRSHPPPSLIRASAVLARLPPSPKTCTKLAHLLFPRALWHGRPPTFTKKWLLDLLKRHPHRDRKFKLALHRAVQDKGEKALATQIGIADHFGELDRVFKEYEITRCEQVCGGEM